MFGRLTKAKLETEFGVSVYWAKTLAEKLFQEMLYVLETTPVLFDNKEGSLNVTVSIGVCTQMTDRLDHMTKLADELLYDAKESGRNCVRISQ